MYCFGLKAPCTNTAYPRAANGRRSTGIRGPSLSCWQCQNKKCIISGLKSIELFTIVHRFKTFATKEILPVAAEEFTDNVETAVTWEEADMRLDHAAAFITMLPLLRPIDEAMYNPAMEIWRRIADIPPHYRHLLVDRLEAGSIRVLWRYSMFRYIWDGDQTAEAFSEYSVLDDFPEEAGKVVSFKGKAEETILKARERMEEIEDDKFKSQSFSLSDDDSQYKTHRFQAYCFMHPESGQLYCRAVPSPFLGLIPLGQIPYYSRLDIDLTTTPVQSDAGADIVLVYSNGETSEEGIGLFKEDVPHWWWPEPALGVTSPFGDAEKDYVRVCGPGVYVGCSYPPNAVDLEEESEFMFFVMAKQVARELVKQADDDSTDSSSGGDSGSGR